MLHNAFVAARNLILEKKEEKLNEEINFIHKSKSMSQNLEVLTSLIEKKNVALKLCGLVFHDERKKENLT